MEIKIVIPSHKRAQAVSTTKVVPNAILCVPESQGPEYRKYNLDVEILTHPDDIIGLAAKRTWIYAKCGDVMMLDDDLTRMVRLYVEPNSLQQSTMKPKEVYARIQSTALTAREMGAFLFGFATDADGRNFKPQRPFRLTGLCNGSSFGLLKGSKIFFHKDCIAVEDYFGSLVNAYYHRYAFFDLRFGFAQKKTFKNAGGQSEFRSIKSEEQDFKFLKRMFGPAVEKRPPVAKRGRASHEWQRVIRMPF